MTEYMYIINTITWSEEKAKWLLEERGISLDSIAEEIKKGNYGIKLVNNQISHPEQKMFIVVLNGYAHCVPFVETSIGNIFLKTAFKSRKYQRDNYEKKN